MADLQLIGAVAVKVRPDARDFRREAKNEIMRQLRDLEGEFDVTVDPNIKYNEAAARSQFRDAFKDLVVDQNITVVPNIDDKAYRKALQQVAKDSVPNPTTVRIGADTAEAENSLADLNNAIADTEGQISRLPSVLRDMAEANGKAFEKFTEASAKARDSLRLLETSVDQARTRSIASAADLAAAKEMEAEAIRAVGQAEAEAAGARDRYETLALQVLEEKDKARKKELTDLRIIANKEKGEAEARLRALQSQLKEARKILGVQERASTKADEALGKSTKQLKDQQKAIEALAKHHEKITQEYEEQRDLLQEQLDAGLLSIEQHKAERAELEALNAARAKSFRELEGSLYQGIQSWDDYRVRVAKGMTEATNYIEHMRQVHSEATGQMKADIGEYLLRIEEFGRRRKEILEAVESVNLDMEVNGRPGWDDAEVKSQFDQWLNYAKDFADDAAAYIERKTPSITIDVDHKQLKTAEGLLDFIARPRDVLMKAKVDKSELILGDLDQEINLRLNPAFEQRVRQLSTDISKAFSGYGFARELSSDMKDMLANFDEVAISAGKMGVAVTAGVGASASAFGGLAAVTSDLGELSGALLLVPAAVVGLGSMVYATMKGFEGFKAAVEGDEEALASFNAEGQRAARTLGRLSETAARLAKEAFWGGLGSDLGDMADAVFDPVTTGLTRASNEMGKFWGGLFRSLEKFANSGDMDTAFRNMNDGLASMSLAAEPFLDALNIMGLAGSRHLPAIGRLAAENAVQFRDWAAAAEESGQMNDWISQAARHLDDLQTITYSTVRTVGALGDAADAAGFGGLQSLARNMIAVADASNNPFFQGNMANLFQGGLEAVESMSRGLYDLGVATLEQSVFIQESFESIGRTVGNIISEIADSMNNERMLTGIREFLADVEEASGNLGPLMDYIAVGIGDAARLAGELVKGALEIAEAFFRVWTNSDNLVAAMEKLIPYLTDVVVRMIELTHVPIDMITEMVAFLVDGFMALPGPVRDAVVALGLLAAVAPKLMAVRTALSMLSAQAKTSNGVIGGFRNTWRTAMSTMSESGRVFMTTSQMLSAQDRAVAKAAFAWRDFSRALGGNGQSFAQAQASARGLLTTIDQAAVKQQRAADMMARSSGIAAAAIDENYRNATAQIIRAQDELTKQMSSSFAASATVARSSGREVISSLREQAAALGSYRAAFRAVDFSMFNTAVKGMATNLGDAAKVVGSNAAGGLRNGISQITSALGGPWVIGFMAAGAAVLDLVSTVKSSQSAFDDFGRNIEEFGSKGEEVASQLEEAFDRDINPQDSFLGQLDSWLAEWDPTQHNAHEAFDKLGISAKEASEAVTGSGDDFGRLMGEIEGLGTGVLSNATPAIEALKELRAEFIEQSVASKNSAAAMGLSEAGAVKLRGAMDVLMDGTGSTTQEIDAMRTSLDALHGGQLTAMQSSMDLAVAEVEAANGLADVREKTLAANQTYGDLFATVEDGGGTLNAQNSIARDLAQTMTEWGDSALSAGKQVYDAAIQSGDGHQAAAEKATAAMDTSKSAMRGLLEEAEFSTEQIDSLLTTFTGQDWELELTFMGKTDQFLEAKGIVEAGGNEIDGKNFTAFLKANPGTTIEDIRTLAQAGMTWEESQFTSDFGAETAEVDEKLAAALKRGEEFDNKDFTMSLSGDDTAFLDTVLTATAKGEDFNSKEFEARFGANTQVLNNKMIEAAQRGEEFGSKEWVASLDAENEGFAEAFLVAEAQAMGFDGTEVTAHVLANINDYSAGLTQAEQLRANLDGTAAEVSVGANTDQYMLKMRAAELAAQGMDDKEIQAQLGLNTEEWSVLTDGTFDNLLNSYRGPHEAEMGLNGAGAVKQQADEAVDAVKKADTTNATAHMSLIGDIPVKQGAETAVEAVKKGNTSSTANMSILGDTIVKTGADTAVQAVERGDSAHGSTSMSITGDMDVVTRAETAKTSVSSANNVSGTASLFVAGAEEVAAKSDTAKGAVKTLDTTTGTATAKVNGVETAKAQTGELVTDVQTLDGTNADPQVNLGGSPAQVREDLDHIQRKLDDIGNKNPTATVTVSGAPQALTDLQGVVDKLTGLTGKSATATITVVGAIQAQADTQRVIDGLLRVSGRTANGYVNINGAPAAIAAIQSVINSMNAAAVARAAPVIQVQGSGTAITQIQSVVANMRTLAGTSANPRVTLIGGPAAISGIQAVQRVLDALGRTNAQPRITLQGAPAAQSGIRTTQGYLDTLGGTTATPNIVLYGAENANGQINGVRQNLADLDGRTATTTIITRRVGENADGSITMFADGGILGAFKKLNTTMGRAVQAFASGGISGVQAFASGGFSMQQVYKELAKKSPNLKENHIAQIASAKTPFRIWAEPETQGESYIPLASSKRARSTRIWEETGNLLGVDWEAYADGGTRGAGAAGGRSSSGRRIERPITVNVTSNYPQAEPTSVTVNRALQFAANL